MFKMGILQELQNKLAGEKVKKMVSKEEIGTNCFFTKQNKFE
jgi:hypothetical protein